MSTFFNPLYPKVYISWAEKYFPWKTKTKTTFFLNYIFWLETGNRKTSEMSWSLTASK